MPSAEELFTTNAEKLLKNLPDGDQEIFNAYIKLKEERSARYGRTFDNILVGFCWLFGLIGAAGGLHLAVVLVTREAQKSTMGERLTVLERTMMEVDSKTTASLKAQNELLEDRDREALQEVKTKCFSFCSSIP